jgi:hypothetical protein
MYNKFWMIVDIADAREAFRGDVIPKDKNPTFLHHERPTAETELLRLQAKHPNGEFILMESVAFAQEKKHLLIEPITTFFEVDEIPF